ncbi:MAG TPA: PLDc N-terminal domain-containing protein [Candidatus Angelobacter sp.]|nr:PLDc N-terminal domain-containing protein [Candidatus Angelobacter sp.]
MFGGRLGIFELLVIFLILWSMIFWLKMLVECATKEPNQGNDKIIWILIIVLVGWLGALIYYFVRRPQRIAQYGS